MNQLRVGTAGAQPAMERLSEEERRRPARALAPGGVKVSGRHRVGIRPSATGAYKKRRCGVKSV